MRRGDDCRDAIVSSKPRHRQRIFPILGAVIDARQHMAMNIDK
jgi:hypothetical protein